MTMTPVRRRLACALLLAIASPGCGPAWTRSELYFGMSDPKDARVIPEERWREFLDREITPRFPDGLTVFDGAGQWREDDEDIAREPSKVLVVVYPRRDRARADAQLDAIALLWCDRFAQESVMRIDARADVAFVTPTPAPDAD